MNKKEYTVQDLISNESFRRLVKGTATNEEINGWNQWIERSEENRKKAQKATAEIVGFQFSEPRLPDIDREWEKLQSDTIGKSGSQLSKRQSDFRTLRWIYRVAAVLLLGAMLGIGSYLYSPIGSQPSTQLEEITKEKTVFTTTDEQKTIKFSNGSRIVLNSNSEVTYSLHQHQLQTIDVVVEGEVYFDAKDDARDAESDKPIFAVNTPDGVIKDIGTKFMVTVQEDRSQVILEEGKVQISTKDQTDSKQISMNAGELIEFNKSKVLNKQKVNTSLYTSWETGFMEFDQTSVETFARFVEQRFEVDVQVTDSSFHDITLDGAVYFKSLAGLVRSVSEVTDIPVYQSADRKTVFIGDPYRQMEDKAHKK